MDKKVMALRGVANVGKTNTIKKVFELLTLKYKDSAREHKILSVDVRCVLTINGIKIGIESQGDPSGRLHDSISLFVRTGCTLIICATRTKGQTVDSVNKLRPNYAVVWYQQNVERFASEQETSNLAMAKQIFGEIEKIINA